MMLKNGKKLVMKQHNFQIQVSTIYRSHWLIYSENGCDTSSTVEILVNQTYITQVNHEILNAKEKELQSWKIEKAFDEIENNG